MTEDDFAFFERLTKQFSGHVLYLVGGSVRDHLCGEPSDDFDFATDATPEEIIGIIGEVPLWSSGVEYGTVGCIIEDRKVEITTFRTETYHDDRHPEVKFSKDLIDDLRRRDFTINAMAMETDGEVIDPFGGQDDLEDRILCTPGRPADSLADDPLRVLRAIRFAAVRGMGIHAELRQAMNHALPLETISQERKTAELHKILIHGPEALLNAHRLCRTEAMRLELFGPFDVPTWVLEYLGDADERTLWTALAASTFVDIQTEELREAFSIMKLPTHLAQHCLSVLRIMGTEHPTRCIRAYSDVELDDALALLRGMEASLQDGLAFIGTDWFGTPEQRAEFRKPLPVNGYDLLAIGMQGPDIGKALQKVEEAFLVNTALTKEEALGLV